VTHAIALPDADATRDLGERLARLVRAGDLVILSGELGAGKTTLVQGLGRGLGVRGRISSPTFIIARVHPPMADGPGLVHVDAYRLGSVSELDALDLDTAADQSVTVVEWGEGIAESLAADRLEVLLERPRGGGSSPAPQSAGAGVGAVERRQASAGMVGASADVGTGIGTAERRQVSGMVGGSAGAANHSGAVDGAGAGAGDSGAMAHHATIRGVGPRWEGTDLGGALASSSDV
jgi:tRNA threonylcarbamoyladenosine biosynthesis protein TsaE